MSKSEEKDRVLSMLAMWLAHYADRDSPRASAPKLTPDLGVLPSMNLAISRGSSAFYKRYTQSTSTP